MHAADALGLRAVSKQKPKPSVSTGALRPRPQSSPWRLQSSKATAVPRASCRARQGSAAQRLGLVTRRLASPAATRVLHSTGGTPLH
jgi:hypothetical protein